MEEDTTKPRFKFQHRTVSTTDDDRFIVLSKYVLDGIFPTMQLLFGIFTLYLWNYASFARYVFSQRKMDWVGELYFAICISGLMSAVLTTVAIFYWNSFPILQRKRRNAERRAVQHGEAPVPEKLQVKTSHFTYNRRILPAMDAHYDFHKETGHHGGDPKLLVFGVNYVLIATLTIIDVGLVVDATNAGRSYSNPRVGGFGFLQVVCLLIGLVVTIVPPRRAYQNVAQAYLEDRFV